MQSTDPALIRMLKQTAYRLGKLCPLKPQTVAEGADLCRTLQGYDFLATLGRLSKFGDDPEQIVREYRQASNALSAGAQRGFYLSVKPPALDFDTDRLAAIAATALENGHGVHLDSHKFAEAPATFKLLEELLGRKLPAAQRQGEWRFSLSLPTRWKRSAEDARWAVQNGVRIRLVKGDFPAPDGEEIEPVGGFLELVEQLAGQVPELALATHDSALARASVARCQKAGSRVVLELFFGRPATSMLELARETGVPVRFYVPYGDTLLVYVIRDLLTNPLKMLRSDSLEILGSPQRKLARITGAG